MIARLKFWLASLLLLALVAPGCAGFINGAYKAKGVLAVSAVAAITSWQAIDLQRQKTIFDSATSGDEARALLQAYRDGDQAKAVKAIRGARYALAALSDVLDAYDAGTAPRAAVAAAIASATSAAADLVAALKAFGVNLSSIDWPHLLGVPLGPVPLTLIHDLVSQHEPPLEIKDIATPLPCLFGISFADGTQIVCYNPAPTTRAVLAAIGGAL